jgi:fatty acid elongase 3
MAQQAAAALDALAPYLGQRPRASADDLRRWLDAWRFVPGTTAFSHWGYPAAATAGYVAMLYVLTRFMKDRKAAVIPRVLFVHNMSLCAGSLWLAVWITYTLGAQALVRPPIDLICSKGMHENGHLHMIYYINSFFKVWEFADTALLVVRKKPVPFLHSYHHAATLVLTWVQMAENSTAQWVPIFINLWVHVFMYYYYAMSAVGVRIWWKKYLTSLQIAQFVIDVSVITYAYYIFIRGGWSPEACYGTSTGAIVGLAVLLSYLLLYVSIFIHIALPPCAPFLFTLFPSLPLEPSLTQNIYLSTHTHSFVQFFIRTYTSPGTSKSAKSKSTKAQ